MAARHYVIDANLTLGLFLRLPYSQEADQWIKERQEEDAKLIVPVLWEYECVSGLHRAVTLKLIAQEEAERMVADLLSLEFHRIPPTLDLNRSALHWAEKIGQSKVYDAHYLAVAESVSAEFWTADQRVVHALQNIGVSWAHAI